MNEAHLELCASDEWAETVRTWVIPGTLEGLDLGDDVVEIGPGPGRTTELLRHLVPRLTAVEVDADLADALAARLGGGNVEVVHADARALPLPDGRFSAALCFTMLHHVPSPADQDRLLAEMARVLRPGAWLAGQDSRDSPEWRELHVGDVCVPVDPDTLPGRLKEVGFTDIDVRVNEFAVTFRARKPLLGPSGS